ncbi:MAG: metal-sensitive transcriptional regulator [Deltaproteobacteria bacterium]|jgi:CsoR family transcriptional regulator, copper-sensing transcriptional repressor|nr:metal-sensitive transcriptional regulator [Deltaproteobacteria bacterium]
MHPDHSNKLKRLNRIEGQVKGIKKMIEDRRYCVDILTQLKAVGSALKKVEHNVLKDHVQGCLKSAIQSGNELDIQNKMDEIMGLIDKRI